MSRYTPRHAPRHAHAGPTRTPLGILRRPAVASSLALAIAATGAAGVHAAETSSGDVGAFAISPQAADQAAAQADLTAADSARFVAERTSLMTTTNVVEVKAEQAERARAAALAEARHEAAAQAAREAQRQAIIANAQQDPRSVGRLLLADFGWSDSQFQCLDLLWTRESNWNFRAQNASSGAYGIAQALPGSKMASIASDWQTNPVTQITWGLTYIKGRYGSPCGAWAHSQATGWY